MTKQTVTKIAAALLLCLGLAACGAAGVDRPDFGAQPTPRSGIDSPDAAG